MTVKVHIYVYVLGQGREELMKDSVADSGEGPPLPPPLSYLKVWIRHWN